MRIPVCPSCSLDGGHGGKADGRPPTAVHLSVALGNALQLVLLLDGVAARRALQVV